VHFSQDLWNHSGDNMGERSMRMKWVIIFLLPFLILMSCMPPVVGVLPRDIDAQIKALRPPRDKALIYIIRPEQVFKKYKVQVTCDGEFVGYTMCGMYLALFVDPGVHIFTSEDSVRLVDDFDAFYQKCKASKFNLFSPKSTKNETEKETSAHVIFIKKHNYALECYRTQSCDPVKMNLILKSKPVPLEMYHAVSVQGGNIYFLIQKFRASWNQPYYLLDNCDTDEGQAWLVKLRHSRYINPKVLPKEMLHMDRNKK
jgi:hypothetical protein